MDVGLLQIFFERFQAFQNLWSLYITIVLGLTGFLATSKEAMKSRMVRTILTIGFIIFSMSNLHALMEVASQRRMLGDLLATDSSTAMQALAGAGQPADPASLLTFHLLFDAAVVVMIWYLPAYRAKSKID